MGPERLVMEQMFSGWQNVFANEKLFTSFVTSK